MLGSTQPPIINYIPLIGRFISRIDDGWHQSSFLIHRETLSTTTATIHSYSRLAVSLETEHAFGLGKLVGQTWGLITGLERT